MAYGSRRETGYGSRREIGYDSRREIGYRTCARRTCRLLPTPYPISVPLIASKRRSNLRYLSTAQSGSTI
eukprot:2169115-Rhodomonas_salina.1